MPKRSSPLTGAKLLPALRREAARRHGRPPKSYLMPEVNLRQGAFRADLVAFADRLHGYEIKGQTDRLTRLPAQSVAYDEAFCTSTLVTVERHVGTADALIPPWWGVWVARREGRRVVFEVAREAGWNPRPDPLGLLLLLKYPESLALRTEFGCPEARVWEIRQWLMENVPQETLLRRVRETLRSRGDWRAAARRAEAELRERRLRAAEARNGGQRQRHIDWQALIRKLE